MLCIILIVFFSVPIISLNAYDVFNFSPVLVNEDIRFEVIESNSKGDIFVAGNEVLNDNPISYTSNIKIFKSSNEGSNWELLFTQKNEDLIQKEKINRTPTQFIFANDSTILLFTENNDVFISNDKGINWNRHELERSFMYSTVKKSSSGEVAALYSSIIEKKKSFYLSFYSNSTGNWNSVRIPIDTLFQDNNFPNITSFFYSKDNQLNFYYIDGKTINDSLIYLKYLVSTSDQGKTWEKKEVKFDNFSNTFLYDSDGRLLVWGIIDNKYRNNIFGEPFGDNLIYESTDDGETWNTLLYEQDTLVNAYLPYNIELYTDKYLLGEAINGSMKFYDFENNKISRILPNNPKSLSDDYGYTRPSDYMIFDNRLFLTSYGSYVFEVDISKPITITNVEFKKLERELLLYPNPISKGKNLNIELIPISIGSAEITIIGVDGREHSKFNENFNSTVIKTTLSKEIRFSAGTYILEILYSNGLSESSSFVVE